MARAGRLATARPALAQQAHRIIRQLAPDADPYADIKQRSINWQPSFIRLASALPRKISPVGGRGAAGHRGQPAGCGREDPTQDFGFAAALADALTAPLCGSVSALAAAIRGARSILYLADNAGEVVFDRDLIAQLPLGSFTVVVRGRPVLNDATLADAQWAGLTELGDVMAMALMRPARCWRIVLPSFAAV
jgi:uncharacterized protein with ATP-grasp and redox domains